MTTLTFNSSTKEITSTINVSDKPTCYVVDFEAKTKGGMVPVGFVQKLKDVPSRGGVTNDAFQTSNALADMFGTNTFEGSSNVYRSRELVNEATAKVLAGKIGSPIEGFTLIVTDTEEPSYEKQSHAISRERKDEQGNVIAPQKDKLYKGKIFYTTVALAQIGTKEHSVFKLDTIGATSKEGVTSMLESSVF